MELEGELADQLARKLGVLEEEVRQNINTQIQTHKYKYASHKTKTQTHRYKRKYANTITDTKYKHEHTNMQLTNSIPASCNVGVLKSKILTKY